MSADRKSEREVEKGDEKKNTLFTQYKNLLTRYPLIINGIQAAVIAGLGVILSQVISGAKVFDFREVRVMMAINFAYHTPILIWFGKLLSNSKLSLLAKVIVDQLFFSPVFTAGIISVRLLLLGTDINSIPSLVISIVPGAMFYSWMFWVPAKAFILGYVPVMYQFLVNNALGLIWNIIFAAILSNSK